MDESLKNKVSVVIPAYNSGRYIKEAIDSVLRQTYKNIEIIVVDDGSTDDTSSIVRGYGDKVTYIYQDNMGHAIARNTGLKASSGEYCCFLDADDTWHPSKTELEAQILDQQPDVGLVHCDQMNIDAHGNALGRLTRDKKCLDGDIFKNLLIRRAHIGTSTALFRRECFERLGMLDETMRQFGSEDREFWLRISKNYTTRYIDAVLTEYRVLKDSLSQIRKMDDMIKGRYMTIDRSVQGLKPALYYNGFLKYKAYSAVNRYIGDKYLLNEEFYTARKYYSKAIGYFPFHFRAWANSIKSVLKVKVRKDQRSSDGS